MSGIVCCPSTYDLSYVASIHLSTWQCLMFHWGDLQATDHLDIISISSQYCYLWNYTVLQCAQLIRWYHLTFPDTDSSNKVSVQGRLTNKCSLLCSYYIPNLSITLATGYCWRYRFNIIARLGEQYTCMGKYSAWGLAVLAQLKEGKYRTREPILPNPRIDIWLFSASNCLRCTSLWLLCKVPNQMCNNPPVKILHTYGPIRLLMH